MCRDCEDFARTVLLLGHLAMYAEAPGADATFVEVMGSALAASLPEPPPGPFPGESA
ncbi:MULTISPECIES: hypothetical protein [Streptomyces]|uniref:hypothetical protein n=1 Tax=Streptomyces TaxID=1883 RepID=UPI0019442859|nr:hypothetical protein [Streptomyces coelicoflavus]